MEIHADLCDQLSVTGILGRCGFLDNGIVTVDSRSEPHSLEVARVTDCEGRVVLVAANDPWFVRELLQLLH